MIIIQVKNLIMIDRVDWELQVTSPRTDILIYMRNLNYISKIQAKIYSNCEKKDHKTSHRGQFFYSYNVQ